MTGGSRRSASTCAPIRSAPSGGRHSSPMSETKSNGNAWLRRLHDAGFVVLPGPIGGTDPAVLSRVHDEAVAAASPGDVHVGRTGSSTRVSGLVDRPAFDALYVCEPLLAACRSVIGGPFRLSSMHARTVEQDAAAQELHVDVQRGDPAWPLVGFIVMIDAFTPENGATRFVPRSHRTAAAPADVLRDGAGSHDGEVLACGPAGSMIVYHGSTWHGFTANRTGRGRRSIQGAFIPRSARPATDHAEHIRPDTLRRIGDLARYLLGVDD